MTPIPKPKQKQKPKRERKADRPVLIRQADDSLIVFGPDLDDINLCDDPC